MAAPALPYSDWIISPVMWTGRKNETRFESASSSMSVSHGFKTGIYEANLEWIVPAAWALDLITQLETLDFNNVYSFTCRTAGATRLYVRGAPNYTERQSGLHVRVWVPVERRV